MQVGKVVVAVCIVPLDTRFSSRGQRDGVVVALLVLDVPNQEMVPVAVENGLDSWIVGQCLSQFLEILVVAQLLDLEPFAGIRRSQSVYDPTQQLQVRLTELDRDRRMSGLT